MGKASRSKRTKRYTDSSRPYAKTPSGIIRLPDIPPEILAIIESGEISTRKGMIEMQQWIFSLPDKQKMAILESMEAAANAYAIANEIHRDIKNNSNNYQSGYTELKSGRGIKEYGGNTKCRMRQTVYTASTGHTV